jgi:hypothetical protein
MKWFHTSLLLQRDLIPRGQQLHFHAERVPEHQLRLLKHGVELPWLRAQHQLGDVIPPDRPPGILTTDGVPHQLACELIYCAPIAFFLSLMLVAALRRLAVGAPLSLPALRLRLFVWFGGLLRLGLRCVGILRHTEDREGTYGSSFSAQYRHLDFFVRVQFERGTRSA